MSAIDPEHPPLKLMRKVSSKKGLETGLCIAEGWKCNEEALKTCKLHCMLIKKNLKPEWEKRAWHVSVPVFFLEESDLKSLSQLKTPEGVFGLYSRPEFCDPAEVWSRSGRHLVLYQWSDPGNMGTAVRTARGQGLDSVTNWGGGPDFFSSKVIRGSMGSVFHMPLAHWDQEAKFPDGVQVLCADASGKRVDLIKLDQQKPLCLVVGSESHGLPEHLPDGAQRVSLDMAGGLESYSAPVAAALLAQKFINP